MKVVKIILLIISCQAYNAYSQEKFAGMVGDSATFVALPFVSIQIKGKQFGTTTDINGAFTLSVTRQDTLVLSSLGYKTVLYPLRDWEPGIILMAEQATLLDDITITGTRTEPYQGMFDEQNEALRKANKRLPFYYSRTKKQKIKIGRLSTENLRVQTYVDVIIKNEQLRGEIIRKYNLTEDEYFRLLGDFNAKNYAVMYYLSAPELISMINNFFASKAPLK